LPGAATPHKRQLLLAGPLAALVLLVAGGGNLWLVLAFIVSAAFVVSSRVVSAVGPSRAVDVAVTAGVALMAVGALAPWGRLTETGVSVTVDGLDRGGLVVLILAALAAFAYASGRHLAVAAAALAGLLWCAVIAYLLPTALLHEAGGGLAEVAWGLLLSLVGVVVVLVGALTLLRAGEPVRG
jgi:hypothetical protein